MSRRYRVDELAREVGGNVVGDGAREIRGVATLERAGPDELSFLTNRRYREAARASRAGAILAAPGSELAGRDLIEVAQPYLALAKILGLLHPAPDTPTGVSDLAWLGRDVNIGADVAIGPFAVVEDGVTLGDRVTVGAGCHLGRDSRVGEDSALRPRVVLYPGTRIGRRCLVHAGVVLGADGFGFATTPDGHVKVPQLGHVVLEDDVELGANTTIDRGALDATVVGRGSKLDNLVMIAHGVRLGEECLIAAQSGVAGSTRLGSRVTVAGQSGAAGHLQIADGTVIAAKSAVLQDVTKAGLVAGVPAVDHQRWKRSQALVSRLPELRRELRELKRRLDRLECLADDEEDGT